MRKVNSDIVLTERESQILNCVVEAYVQAANPVGSSYLTREFNLGISSATVRNVMNDLEEMGFLCQPHVSAGRVPTDKGYRFYVDSVMSIQRLRSRDRRFIQSSLNSYTADVRQILDAASRVLGRISAQLGVVLEPRFYQGIFKKMELVGVAENRIMAIISIESGLVKTILMEIESAVSREQLHQTSFIINERLSGLSLREVKETIDLRLTDVALGEDGLIRVIIDSSDRLFSFEDDDEVHLGGTKNIVSNPEFSEQKDIARIVGLIESKDSIMSKFHLHDGVQLLISIGEENEEVVFHSCSVIAAPYSIGNVSGALGVVGPTRMAYARIIPLVNYMGTALTKMLSTRGAE